MFLETTPERKIYKELAADHFADPKGWESTPSFSVPPRAT